MSCRARSCEAGSWSPHGARDAGLWRRQRSARATSTREQLFATITQESLDALWVPGGFLFAFHQEITEFAVQKGLPTMGWNGFVERGGLMTYETFGSARVVAQYVDRLLKGAQPAELPIERPLCCKLVINLKTAKALGL